MIIVIAVAVLVVAIAAFQVIQGLYTALINAILTVLAAMFALAYYENLSVTLQGFGLALLSDGLGLVLLFAVRLLVRDNVVFGAWADRIGGGILGLVTGIFSVGILTLAMQMLPFDQTVLSYRPYDNELNRAQTLAPFTPDEVVASAARTLSEGSLSAGKPLGVVHSNYPLELFAARNTASRNGRIDTPPTALTVLGLYEPPADQRWMENLPEDALLSKSEQRTARTVIVRVNVDEQARGEDDWYRMPATHFRLVTRQGRGLYPVGYLTGSAHDEDKPKQVLNRQVKVIVSSDVPRYYKRTRQNEDQNLTGRGGPGRANLIVLRPWKKEGGPKKLTIDWVYRVPADAELSHMVFRRVSSAALPEEITVGAMPSGEQMLFRLSEQD
ncbi:MAG: hypothetical protein ACLFV7_03245 [Phycisphaerae bacterium]